jgi:hypothetical protein
MTCVSGSHPAKLGAGGRARPSELELREALWAARALGMHPESRHGKVLEIKQVGWRDQFTMRHPPPLGGDPWQCSRLIAAPPQSAVRLPAGARTWPEGFPPTRRAGTPSQSERTPCPRAVRSGRRVPGGSVMPDP